ncbi:hypothetical protein M0804_000956 [Polistes exclamans]|nr:hypothetical protein M0804_000956 [Polistes exclamans]
MYKKVVCRQAHGKAKGGRSAALASRKTVPLVRRDASANTYGSKLPIKVYGKDRVVRGCGYITDQKDNGECLLRTGTHDVRAHYCACTGDLCNSAEKRRPSSLLNLATVATIIVAIPSLILSSPFSLPVLTSSNLSVA